MHARASIHIKKIIIINSEAKIFDAREAAKYPLEKREKDTLYVLRVKDVQKHNKLYMTVKWDEVYIRYIKKGKACDWLVIGYYDFLFKCRPGSVLRDLLPRSNDKGILSSQVFLTCEQLINESRKKVFSQQGEKTVKFSIPQYATPIDNELDVSTTQVTEYGSDDEGVFDSRPISQLSTSFLWPCFFANDEPLFNEEQEEAKTDIFGSNLLDSVERLDDEEVFDSRLTSQLSTSFLWSCFFTNDEPLFNEKQEKAITDFFGSDLLDSVKKLVEFFIIKSRNYGWTREKLDVEFPEELNNDKAAYDEKSNSLFIKEEDAIKGEDTFYQLVELLKGTPAKTSKKTIDWYENVQAIAFRLEEELKQAGWGPFISKWMSRILGAITLAIPGVICGVKYGAAGAAVIGGGAGSIPAATLGGIMGGLIGLGFGMWSGYKLSKWSGYWVNSAIARADYSAKIVEVIQKKGVVEDDTVVEEDINETEDDISEIEEDISESPCFRRQRSSSACSSN